MTEAGSPGRPRLWFLGVVGLHVGLLAYFMPPRLLVSREPIATVDYALHAYQVDRAWRSWRSHGQLWSWDPQVLAGQPAGVIEDLTSKLTELFVIAMNSVGVNLAVAYNGFIALTHLAVPFLGYATARVWRLSRGASVLAALLWVLLWYFDSFMHWAWWVGMITWSGAACLSVLLVGLAHRWLDDGPRWAGLGLLVVTPLLAILHPFAALTVGLPILALWLRAFRTAPPARHLVLVGAGLLAGATALLWIRPLLAFRHYLGDVDTFFKPTAAYLLYDTFDLIKDGRQTGIPMRTAWRTLCFLAGAVVLVRWWRAGDRRALGLGLLAGLSLLLAYLSGYAWAARQTQPYRQIAPAMLAAAIPAAALLTEVLAPAALRALPTTGRWLAALLGVLALPRLVGTTLYFIPEALPERVLRSPMDVFSTALVLPLEPKAFPMRHEHASADYTALRAWLDANWGGRGRVVVSDWVATEFLAWSSSVPLLGGIPERPLPHIDAHLFRQNEEGDLGPELGPWLERYAVGFVVMHGHPRQVERRKDLLEPLTLAGGFRIYRVRAEPTWTLRGSAVVEQQLNLLRVSRAVGAPDVVLRFHWLETLRCRPGCTVEREEVPGARPGFLRVPNPPAEFEIYNSYELPR